MFSTELKRSFLQALISVTKESAATGGRWERSVVEGYGVGGKLTNEGTKVGHVGG